MPAPYSSLPTHDDDHTTTTTTNHHYNNDVIPPPMSSHRPSPEHPPPTTPVYYYFGIPIVGFFHRPTSMIPAPRYDEEEETHHHQHITRRNPQWSQTMRERRTTNYGSVLLPFSSSQSESPLRQQQQQQRRRPYPSECPLPFHLSQRDPQQSPESSDTTTTTTTTTTTASSPTQPQKRRTAHDLWDLVRFHVHHETFHIDSAHWRRPALAPPLHETNRPHTTTTTRWLLFTQSEYDHSHEKNFRDLMDLPYDFTIYDCVGALVVYLAISVLAYSFVFERWSIIDSMYFACVSFTTIGYGDLSPSTAGGRFFCIFFALGGVAILAIALGVLGSRIIEQEVQAMESTQRKIVDQLLSRLPPKMKDNPKVLHHSSSSAADQGGPSPPHSSSSFDYLRDFDDPTIHDDYDDYNSMSKMKQCQEYCTLFTQLMCRYVPSLFPLFIGSLIIGHNEGWSMIDSIYYCVVTTTTIGYGDRVPQHEGMKLFAVFFIPLSVGAMGHFLGTIANFIIEQRRKAYDKQLWKHELTMQDLYCMNETGVVTELDFVIFMLQAMKKVDRELIQHIRHHFQVLDVTHSNTLCRDDLELMTKTKLRSVKTKLRMSAYRKSLIKSGSATPPGSALTTPLPSFD